MIGVEQAREAARTRLQARLTEWASATEVPVAPVYTIALKPPSEREMLGDEAAAERWVRQWAELPPVDGVEVEWETRSWRSIGRQRVPVRVRLRDPDVVARFAGGQSAHDWMRLRDRVGALRHRLGSSEALGAAVRGNGDKLLRYDDARFAQIVDAVQWLIEHPVAGLRPRQLPIRGVDTKWFGANRGVVTALHGAVTGSTELGIVDADRLIRTRVLDGRLALGGGADFAAPVAQLRALPYTPDIVLILENLETVLALPALPGTIAVHGSGYAVDHVAELTWVQQAPVLYWGDLDSNGLAILHQLRSAHPRVTSVLMDEETLLDHRDLWVTESTPARGRLDRLTDAEQRALERIRDEGDVRLEQERIPWSTALRAVEAVHKNVI